MKNAFKLIGIFALVAAIGLSMAACGGGDDDSGGGSNTKFEGRWLNQAAINFYGYNDFSFTFTGNSFTFKSAGAENNTFKGTFTFTDAAIAFTPDAGETWSAFTQGYTLTGNTLSLAQGGKFGYGDFIKQ